MAKKQYMIRWTRSDYAKLGRAVSDFNKKIDKLQEIEEKTYLPAKINYKEEKQQILTRKNFNKRLNGLRAFLKEGAEELIEVEGNKITKWEKRQIDRANKNYVEMLNKELASIDKTLKPYKTQREREIEKSLKLAKNTYKLRGKNFEEEKKRIQILGNIDFSLKKALNYKKNYLQVMQDNYQNFQNFDKLMKKMLSISDPFRFFEIASKNELMQDLYYMSSMRFTQNDFDWFAKNWGLTDEELEGQEDVYTDKMLAQYEISLSKRRKK